MEEIIFSRYPELKACRFCDNLCTETYYEYDHPCTSMCVYEEGKEYDLDYANGCEHFKSCSKISELIEGFKKCINPYSKNTKKFKEEK